MTSSDIAFNDLPLDLPHAGRIALRICRVIQNRAEDSVSPHYQDIFDTAIELNELLFTCRLQNEAPVDEAESEELRQSAATLGRKLTHDIEEFRLGDDRLGQCIRNLFECLAMGREGAQLSLRAGENPYSLQRPI